MHNLVRIAPMDVEHVTHCLLESSYRICCKDADEEKKKKSFNEISFFASR